MARKRKKVPKTGAVWRMSAEEATLAKMPRYDAWACGHGPHGPAGYKRAKEKRAWDKQMQQEGVRKGSFLFPCPLRPGEKRYPWAQCARIWKRGAHTTTKERMA